MDIKHHVKISLSKEEHLAWDKLAEIFYNISAKCSVYNAEEREMSNDAASLLMDIRDFWDKWINDEP